MSEAQFYQAIVVGAAAIVALSILYLIAEGLARVYNLVKLARRNRQKKPISRFYTGQNPLE